MRHLYSSKVRVIQLSTVWKNGSSVASWNARPEIIDEYCDEPGTMFCRLDLQLVRVGRDQTLLGTQGVLPDRFGVLFCDYSPYLERNNKIVCLEGPVTGTFDINAIPDVIQSFNTAHHIEVQIVESSQIETGHHEKEAGEVI